MNTKTNGKWSQVNSIPTQLSKKSASLSKNSNLEQVTNSTSSATSVQCTRSSTKISGLFNRQQMEHFWTNFNYDLYNRICEIKYSEL